MMDTETIEVKGVRFSAEEVRSVTIDRDGCEIRIAVEQPAKPVGFQRPENRD